MKKFIFSILFFNTFFLLHPSLKEEPQKSSPTQEATATAEAYATMGDMHVSINIYLDSLFSTLTAYKLGELTVQGKEAFEKLKNKFYDFFKQFKVKTEEEKPATSSNALKDGSSSLNPEIIK